MTNAFLPNHPQNTTPQVQNEIQKVTLNGVGGGKTFALTFDGATTSNVASNATAATLQTAMEGLSNVSPGDVTVTGSAGGPYSVEFKGRYAATDVPLMTGTATEGTVTVTTTQASNTGVTRGTGAADATSRTSPLSGTTPPEQRAARSE